LVVIDLPSKASDYVGLIGLRKARTGSLPNADANW
jgi:hypothetical protein